MAELFFKTFFQKTSSFKKQEFEGLKKEKKTFKFCSF